ncbi:MAG: cytochrome c biogenesis protein CcsA [Bacteroidaceae bacterium]|nr:cytochrome c biogenesis protein CcsA [Bacteroidaceae bacterium]
MNKQKTLLYIRRTSFALYAILVVIMAIATIVENYYGTDFAHQHIYEAWWFIALWIAALLTTLPCVPRHIQGIWRQLRHQRTAATALMLFATTALTAAEVRVTERAQADSLRTLQVIYNNRICPLNTPARDFVLKLTGKPTFQGLTAEQVFLSWAQYPEDWKDVEMIKVKKAAAKHQLGIKGDYARFADFFDAHGNYRLIPGDFPDLEDRLTLVVLLTKGKLFDPLPRGVQPLSPRKVQAELFYNAVPWDTILFASCFTLAFLLFFLTLWKKADIPWVRTCSTIVKCLLTLLLVVSLGIRWYISEHIPLSNTYETLLIIALTALVIASLTHKNAIPPLLVAGATLLVAHIGALDPQVTSLMPALQSPWLSSHVTTIMISYCLFALLLFRPNRTMLIWAELLLGTGILLGSIWAKTAWGTYWSWDPKETWALISLIVYMYPLHTATLPWFRSESHQKLYLRLAFLTILMTYFGCNYLLTGMHSYK